MNGTTVGVTYMADRPRARYRLMRLEDHVHERLLEHVREDPRSELGQDLIALLLRHRTARSLELACK